MTKRINLIALLSVTLVHISKGTHLPRPNQPIGQSHWCHAQNEPIAAGVSASIYPVLRCNDEIDPRRYVAKQFLSRSPKQDFKTYSSNIHLEHYIATLLSHSHPHIVNTVDLVSVRQESDNATFFQIIEWMPRTISSVVFSTGLSDEQVALIFGQVASAYAHMNSLGIAHRDIRMDNVMLDEQGNAKVIDFGLSEIFINPLTQARRDVHGLWGARAYAPPEAFEEPFHDPVPADIWSLGILYVTMILRDYPWRGANKDYDSKYRRFINASARHELFAVLPPEARPLMTRILEPEPSKRACWDDIWRDPWFQSIAPE